MIARWRAGAAIVLVTVLTGAGGIGRAAEQVASAFASVGVVGPSGEAPPVTLFVVPENRSFILTDVLIANRGQEVGPLYLADSSGTRCAVELLQTTLVAAAGGAFHTLANPHTSFASGIPFGPGEAIVATLVGGTRGVDVTITGKLLPVRAKAKAVQLPGGARGESPAPEPKPAAP